jgi:hypothetical protein
VLLGGTPINSPSFVSLARYQAGAIKLGRDRHHICGEPLFQGCDGLPVCSLPSVAGI